MYYIYYIYIYIIGSKLCVFWYISFLVIGIELNVLWPTTSSDGWIQSKGLCGWRMCASTLRNPDAMPDAPAAILVLQKVLKIYNKQAHLHKAFRSVRVWSKSEGALYMFCAGSESSQQLSQCQASIFQSPWSGKNLTSHLSCDVGAEGWLMEEK